MKLMQILRKALCLLLVVSLLAGFALPAGAAMSHGLVQFELEQVDSSAVTAERPIMGPLSGQTNVNENEMVRVSIQLEKASTIDAGFSLKGIGANVQAMAYRQSLRD